MPTIAPSRSSLQVMPGAPSINPALFTQVPDPAQGMKMFEQAAKLPLLMEQIKMEKYKQKAEKAKLDLAELTAQQQMSTLEKDAARQNLLADAQLAITQAQAAGAAKTRDQVATEEANAAAIAEAVAIANRLGIDVGPYTEAGTGRVDVAGLRQAIVEKTSPSPVVTPPLTDATITSASKVLAEDAEFPELQEFTGRLTKESPHAVAVARYNADNPNLPLNALPAAEQLKVLTPYLQAAAPTTDRKEFVKDGEKYEASIVKSKDGLVVYRIDKPLRQSSAPETRATATVKTKLAFLDETDRKIDTLISHLDQYAEKGAFGWYDTLMAKWAQSPETVVPLRAVANAVGNDATKALASELAGIGAKTMTELAGSAQTKGEAERLGPYVPASTDPVLGKEELRRKLVQFKEQLGISKESLITQFGMKPKTSAPAGTTPAPEAKAPTAPLDKAISDYLNAP